MLQGNKIISISVDDKDSDWQKAMKEEEWYGHNFVILMV